MRASMFPWNQPVEPLLPKVIYRSLYAKGDWKAVQEVCQQGTDVWFQEYAFEACSRNGISKNFEWRKKAKVCYEDINRTLESLSAKAVSEGYEFCYSYSCNAKQVCQWGLEYCVDPSGVLHLPVVKLNEALEDGGACKASCKMEKKPRTKKTDSDIRLITQYFQLPMRVATKKLNMGATALKKICRRHGITRWPYRRVSRRPMRADSGRVPLTCMPHPMKRD